MERYIDEEEKKRNEAYEKHKCKGCEWASWQQKSIVVCLFPRCVKDKWFEGVKRVLETLESE
ncbi:hypothetical protein HNR63_001092 [Anoxybacillus kamchatkensis]|uniref:hypothetical protein n=1 Tax=Anoxybacillus ayderensis TaxID=265546 RepID=UPI0015EB2E81|nr:hypothetical protein [Anoxybacillus ayderensis]MBA2878038.1 hypothetical protein [Anoxybacillus ayderensis]